jgi:tetratricopeptide (TPR) repeat protein
VSKQRNFAPAAFVIFVVAFTLRFIHIWQIGRSPLFATLLGDARSYDEWAQRIAGGEWIGRDVFYQAPLYPYFLGTIYSLAGRSLMGVRIVQAVIGACSCVLISAAARRLFSARVGLIAGLMLAIYAPAIFFDGLLQKSVLDVFFVCLALWLISESSGAGSLSSRWLPLGLAIGGLSLTRENALVFTIVVLGWTLLRFNWRAAAFFALGVVLILLPVAVRNSLVGGGFYLTTSQFGPNFFIGNHSGANGSYQSLRYGRGAPEYERQDATELAEHALDRTLTPAEVSSFWTGRALAFIKSDPGAWLKLMARKAALLANATEKIDTEDQATYADRSIVLRLLGPFTHFGILVPLALAGIFATWRDRSRCGIIYALLAAYSGSVLLFYVVARYRYPLVPMLVLFAAAGAVFLARGFRPTSEHIPALALIVTVAVFVNWPMGSVSAMRAVTETNLGTALETDHKLDEAIAHYRRAIALEPGYAPAYNNLGRALREENRAGEAADSYQHALDLQPDFATADYNFANLLLDEGKPAAAVEHFESAIRKEPPSADVHNNFGIALASLGRTDEALREFRQAIDLDRTSAKAYRNLGDTLASRGHWPEAISALRRAVDLDPNDAALRYDLASTLLEAGSSDAAIQEFRITLRLAPDMVDAHNNLGIALGSQGKLDDAIEEFRRALAIQPAFADAQKNLATALAARRGR